MTYREVIRRVAANLNAPSISSSFVATVKRDLFDVFNTVTRKAEHLKKKVSVTIDDDADDATYDTSSYTLPSDFFFPVELIFFNSNGNVYMSAEMTRESYERWTPNVELETESFAELVTSATPDVWVWTDENFMYDGKIGYLFTETSPQQLIWKPAVNGSFTLLYAEFNASAITEAGTPEMHAVFHELLVVGVTLKLLHRMMLDDTMTEIKLYSLRASIKEYKEQWKDLMGDFTGFTEKKTTFEVDRMQPFDFLNNTDMIL